MHLLGSYCLSIGATIGFIVADTQELANQAAQKVSDNMEYELENDRLPAPLSGAIYTIDEAIAKEELLKETRVELHTRLAELSGSDLIAEGIKWGMESEAVPCTDDNERRSKLATLYNEM